jgi:nudix-type nucleoside diphosphatase (YffH/AdpP family)
MGNIRIKEEKIISDKFCVFKEIEFDLQKKTGEWETQKREVLSHGNAVTAILYNREQKTVLLTRQFRIATYVNGNSSGMLTETCAGLLENNEDPEAAAKREIEEETGYKITGLKKLYEAYSSAGVLTELVHYYLAYYTADQKVSAGGGLEEEGEEVRVMEIPFDDAWHMTEKGELKDAKTILLLLHLKLHELL